MDPKIKKLIYFLKKDNKQQIQTIIDLMEQNDKLRKILNNMYEEKVSSELWNEKLIHELRPLLDRELEKYGV